MGNDGRQRYKTKFYNLDGILSVGYRVNSVNATAFRRWATRVIKEYLLRGYVFHQRIESVERLAIATESRVTETEKRLSEAENKIDFFAYLIFKGGYIKSKKTAILTCVRNG